MHALTPDFRLLFESIPGSYLVLTPGLVVVAASEAYLEATMTSREGILGRFMFDIFPDNPDDPAATGVRNLRASLERVVQLRHSDTMAVQKYDIRRPPEQGGGFEQRYWSPFNVPLLDKDGNVLYIVHRIEDVTEFVRLREDGVENDRIASELRERAERSEADVYLRAQEIMQTNERLRDEKSRSERLLRAYERAERVSARFQEAALPQALPNIRGFDLDACYRPGRSEAQIGGDWYDALELSDGRLVVSVGDVSGHGLRAAVTMGAIRQLLRGIAYVNPDPALMLDGASKLLQSEHPDTYASAFVGVIDPVEMRMTYASAGHPAPLLAHPDGSIEELSAPGILLGIPIHGSRAKNHAELRAGATIVMYTDGLLEWSRDLIHTEAQIRAFLSSGALRKTATPATAVYDAVVGESAQDDVAVLTVSISPAATARGEHMSIWTFEIDDAVPVQHARNDFAERLREMGVSEDEVYAAEMVFGELVGNAVRHGRGPIEVRIDWRPDAPVLHVLDNGPGFTYLPRLPRDPMSESGRGLFLISQLAEDFNVTRGPNGGTHARALLSLSHRRVLAGF